MNFFIYTIVANHSPLIDSNIVVNPAYLNLQRNGFCSLRYVFVHQTYWVKKQCLFRIIQYNLPGYKFSFDLPSYLPFRNAVPDYYILGLTYYC